MTKKDVDTVLLWADSCFIPGVRYEKDRILRIQAFKAIRPLLKGKLYWYALKNTYTGSDDLFEYRDYLKELFESDEPYRDFILNREGRKYLIELPNEITIYRGMTIAEFESKEFGISWSLKKEVAEFFANKYMRNFSTKGEKTKVHKLKISKDQILAYFNERNEHEIIYIQRANLR